MGNYLDASNTIPGVELAANRCLNSHSCLAIQGVAATDACSDCYLNRHCLACELDTQCRAALSDVTDHPRPLQKGEHCYRQSDEFYRLYIVRSGAVKTYCVDEEGEENITGFYLPGEMFGIDGVSTGIHRYCAVALDTTAVCAVDFLAFEALFAQHPAIHRQFTRVLCDEIYARQQPLLRLRQFNAEVCLGSFLVDIAQRLSIRTGTVTEFTLPMSRRDIARYLCLAEETVSRMFKRFQERKLLTIKARHVKHLDVAACEAMATERAEPMLATA